MQSACCGDPVQQHVSRQILLVKTPAGMPDEVVANWLREKISANGL
jgi:hypothetical protein